MTEEKEAGYIPDGNNELQFNANTLIRIIQFWLDTFAPRLGLKVHMVSYNSSIAMFSVNVSTKAQE